MLSVGDSVTDQCVTHGDTLTVKTKGFSKLGRLGPNDKDWLLRSSLYSPDVLDGAIRVNTTRADVLTQEHVSMC